MEHGQTTQPFLVPYPNFHQRLCFFAPSITTTSMIASTAYCAYCLVFGDDKGIFRTVGFNGWENATGEKGGTFKIHEKSKTHVSSMDKADNLVMVSHEKKLDISRFISKASCMIMCSMKKANRNKFNTIVRQCAIHVVGMI
jgi:hypothetical protein